MLLFVGFEYTDVKYVMCDVNLQCEFLNFCDSMGAGRLSHVTDAMQVFFCHWEFVTQRFLHWNGKNISTRYTSRLWFFPVPLPSRSCHCRRRWMVMWNRKKGDSDNSASELGIPGLIYRPVFLWVQFRWVPVLAMGPWFRCTRIFLIEIPETCQRDSLSLNCQPNQWSFGSMSSSI